MAKEIGIMGLGRMGIGMAQRLLNNKIRVVAYNRSEDKVNEVKKKGAVPAYTLEELVLKLKSKPKIIWIMLPAGKPTDNAIKDVLKILSKGDIIVDGANDFYKNAEKHAKICGKSGVVFFDAGVSGGIHGLKNGYAIMVGGNKSQFKHIEPLCKALAPKNGYGYFGKAGSGHFVKSVHNIIEYVYLEGIAEGVELLNKKNIELKKAFEVFKTSVIKSWLIELTEKAVNRKDFNKIKPRIGSVTMNELIKTKNSVKSYAPAFDSSLKVRKDKSKKLTLGKRTIAAVRNEFGGHEIKK